MGRIPSAQCPKCEAQEFRPAEDAHVYACRGCGAHVHHAHLVSQVARSACLNAAAIAHLVQHAHYLAN